MSEDRLVSSRELACAFRNIAMSYATDAMNTDGAERVLNEYAYEVAKNIAEGLESGKIGLTVDAVPREEHESLLKRFRHLLESDYIRSFDEVIPLSGGKYKRDIREADRDNQRAHWIANNICSRCHKGIRGYAIQSGYVFCPFCGADMREVDS